MGWIRGTNTLTLHNLADGMLMVLELLTTHTPGVPVVNDSGEFTGFISEVDVLLALEASEDLSKLTTKDFMISQHISVTVETTIEEAVKIMEGMRLHNVSVQKDGKVAYSLVRHDWYWDFGRVLRTVMPGKLLR